MATAKVVGVSSIDKANQLSAKGKSGRPDGPATSWVEEHQNKRIRGRPVLDKTP